MVRKNKKELIKTADMSPLTEVKTIDLITVMVILNGGTKAFQASDMSAMAGMMARITEIVGEYLPDEFELSDEHMSQVKESVLKGAINAK